MSETIAQLELVKVGDILKIKWPNEKNSNESQASASNSSNVNHKVKVIEIRQCKKHNVIELYDKKHSKDKRNERTNVRMQSHLKYKLFFLDTGIIKSCRLYDLKYKIIEACGTESITELSNNSTATSCSRGNMNMEEESHYKKRKTNDYHNTDRNGLVCLSTRSLIDPTKVNKVLPSHRYILAPMVGASELPFRILCRRYGSDLGYTPMISSDRYVNESEYREQEFQTCNEDSPVVAHFSANKPDIMRQAAFLVQDKVAAIDLNLGCPQRIAHSGHFGSYLLEEKDRELVLSIVNAVATTCSKPIFVKIRLLDSVSDTIRLCQQLQNAGASLITIHGRYRVNLVARTGAGARDGPAYLDQIAAIKQAIPNIPIISNGNITQWDDVVKNLFDTQCDGVMSAEGILDNPALFSPSVKLKNTFPPVLPLNAYDPNIDNISKLHLANEYLMLVDRYPTKMKSIVFHIRRMLKQELLSYQLMDECLAATELDTIKSIVAHCVAYKEHTESFVFDPLKQQKIKDALAKKQHEEGLRKAYEARMIRKAKREGKTGSDLLFYLKVGLDPPTKTFIAEMRQNSINEIEKIRIWREKFSQHCYNFHFGLCERDRKCAFLHSDAVFESGVTDIMEDSEKFG